MTGGIVMILGETGANVGAGMTGGQLYAYDPDERLPLRLNDQLVVLERPSCEELADVRALLERHERYTGSARALWLLSRWDDEAPRWWRAAPRDEVAELQSAYEGTATEAGAGK